VEPTHGHGPLAMIGESGRIMHLIREVKWECGREGRMDWKSFAIKQQRGVECRDGGNGQAAAERAEVEPLLCSPSSSLGRSQQSST